MRNYLVKDRKYKTKDSGKRRIMKSGSQRDSRAGKGRYDLIPAYPYYRLAQLYERGGIKYTARNWEKGQPLSVYLDSAERHLNEFKMGMRDEDHATAVSWNMFGLVHTEEMIRLGKLPAHLDDLPNHTKIPLEKEKKKKK